MEYDVEFEFQAETPFPGIFSYGRGILSSRIEAFGAKDLFDQIEEKKAGIMRRNFWNPVAFESVTITPKK